MDNGQVNLGTEHMYWRVMRDFVEPVVRSMIERESTRRSNLEIGSESLVLEDRAEYYSFDIRLRDNPLERWRFRYMLDCDSETVRLEAVRTNYPFMKPLVISERDVDDIDDKTAEKDIREGLGRILDVV